MSPLFDGKIALVTGGARNVGKAIALRLAADGAFVIINHFRSPAEARETKAEIEAAGGRASIIRASVANPSQRDRMFDEIASEFGGLDILVNNAADGRLTGYADVEDAMIDRAIDTNLKGGLGCARRAVELMSGRAGANVVNVSTLGGGQFVMADYLACGPAKAAVEAMTRYLAVEFADLGIRVNTAAAGMLESPVADQFPRAEEMKRAIVAATPMRRLGTPGEFAEVVAFLASPKASWITGQIILADGGLSTGHALLAPPRERPHVDRGNGLEESEVSASEPISAATAAPSGDVIPTSVATAVDDDTIAIVGMGIAVSGANNPQDYWTGLLNGMERFMTVPADRWDDANFYSPDPRAEDKSYSQHSAFITDFIPHPTLAEELRRSGRTMDDVESTTLWLRHSVLQALESVTQRPDDRYSFLTGYTADGSQYLEEATVVAGVMRRIRDSTSTRETADVQRWLTAVEARLRARYPRAGTDPHRFFPHQVGLGAIDGILPAATEVMMVDTACSSSLYAIDIGIMGLLENRHDVAVCGGAFAVGPRGSVLFAKLNGLSKAGAVRSLDKDSDGVLFSDGAATVVLKRLGRARADGDRILATIKAFGTSSDGKGKAIYAPSAAGQALAIRRAMARPSMDGRTPEWVVAHATGTPAGDIAEFTTLRTTFGDHDPVRVTSNKSVIGHTGWAAGTSSLIQVLLGFEHGVIPRQHRFLEAPAEFQLDSCGLDIPTTHVPWPARPAGEPRVASVSGFGFGGTNAHLIVQESVPIDEAAPQPTRAPRSVEVNGQPTARMAVVGVAAHLPGAGTLREWLENPSAALSFGDIYPVPPITEVKMPPGLMRAIDRCQLMILTCARTIRDALGDFWTANQLDTGVVLGHFGNTRNATLYATRCYLDDMRMALRGDPSIADAEWLETVLDDVAADIGKLVPPSSENTFPGMMPNVIPARVANYFGLNGLNMTVDTGFTSALSAIDVAERYLRAGELKMALVGGINGNATPEQRELLSASLPAEVELAEGAFLLALTTESTALDAGLPVLGFLETVQVASADDAIECGARTPGRRTTFLGGEGAVGIMSALDTLVPGGHAVVVCRGDDPALDRAVRVSSSVPTTDSRDSGSKDSISADYEQAHAYRTNRGEATGDIAPTQVDVHAWQLAAEPGTTVRARVPFWPDEPMLVLTDDPALLRDVPILETAIVLSTAPTAVPTSRIVGVSDVTPPAVAALLDHHDPDGRILHLRLVTTLGATSSDEALSAERTARVQALHDLLFLVVNQRADALKRPGATSVAVLAEAITGQTVHPYVGLYTGFFKVMHLEHPNTVTFAHVTDATAADAIDEVEAESGLDRALPISYYCGGTRHVNRLSVITDDIDTVPRFDPKSVIVAVGGGRGITAELMVAMAGTFGGRYYLLGSSTIDASTTHLEMTDEDFVAAKRDFIRDRLAADPTSKAGELNREYQRIGNVRKTTANLRRIAAAGAGAVTYLACDVTDAAAVQQTMDRILGEVGHIDLLVNAAGLNRSAPISAKDFREFRSIRDIKLMGYVNLVSALAAAPPKAWCNFGSLLGVTGQIGEADYASGNDFLGTAAMYRSRVAGRDESTLGWTLWGEVGLGANELTKAYFDKSGQYSNMTNDEGAHHFLRYLQSRVPRPYVTHLGVAEYGAVDALLPGFLPPTPRPFYLDRLVAEGNGDELPWAVYERTFDMNADGYLGHHRVNGSPTLPGAFVTEIAFEAASALVPELRVYAMEDVEFHHFLKVPDSGQSSVKHIRAQLLDRRSDPDQARIAITVTGDVTAPNGTVLVKDKLHFTATVLSARILPPAPHWAPWYPAAEKPAVDPYHVAGSTISLTDVFASTTATRLHPLGKRSSYCLQLPAGDPVFSRFRVPVILLDGLLRTGVLADDGVDGCVPVAAPLRLGRLDLYEHTNDAQVGRAGPVDLYAVMPSTDDSPGAENRFVAVRSDGRVVLAIKDLDWALVGHVDVAAGEFLTPQQYRDRRNERMQLV